MKDIVSVEMDVLESEIVILGKASELTTGDWGMWPEITGEEARSA